jgi:beta-glucosidase/6-phospho-beta-glucosidase/beta-galactosidase
MPDGTALAAPASRLFDTFWLGGFEASCHINRAGQRLDLIAATQHDRLAAGDYALLREFGLRAARDGVRWHLVDRGSRYDFASLAPMVAAARDCQVQAIWDLCHYGWPDDLDLLSAAFVDRFAAYAAAVARFMRAESDAVPFFTPVNEISFLSYAVDRGLIFPFARGRAPDVKRQLVRAALAGMDAIWQIEPRARFVHVDPVFNVVPPRDRPDLAERARAEMRSQFEAWDMLSGRAQPELGGHPKYLDILGVNYYHANQWELPENRLRWEDNPRDDRWIPLSQLLRQVHQRYHRPLFIAETSHFGAGRVAWLWEVLAEVALARSQQVPVEGLCIYPIIDRPDWDDAGHWHTCGLWDLRPNAAGRLERVLCADYAAGLRQLMDHGCYAPPQAAEEPQPSG